MDKVARGEIEDEPQPSKEDVAAEPLQPVVPQDMGTEPPPADFILNAHNVLALDLYVHPSDRMLIKAYVAAGIP